MKDYSIFSDEEILGMINAGDNQAMDYLFRRYKPLVEKKSHSYFISGGGRDDLMQEGMIGLFKAIRDFEAEKNIAFFPFADLCITRQIITAVKRSARKKHGPLNNYISLNKPAFEEEESDEDLLDYVPSNRIEDPEDLIIGQEELLRIKEELLSKLSELEKQVLHLHLSGINYKEVAEILDRPVKSVDNALQRIKKKTEEVVNAL
ncbi:RNA polymerase sporulation sigma factor SigH [Clostridiales bacterium COT073_COT-073]|nr:RNA polymerase sporulation sigma factor SigH [Clostridiales bacterium COT073_COT-073]